jgi:hypothetical protein
MNVTIVDPSTSPGFLAIKPTAAAPTTSLINWYEAGPAVQAANQGIVTIDQDVPTAAEFVIVASGPVHVIVDIFGAFIAPQWGTIATNVEFVGVAPAAGCGGDGALGPRFGSTTSLTDLTVATMFFDQSSSFLGLKSQYTRGRVLGLCRGAGVIEIRSTNNCSTLLATVTCSPGIRPWTIATDEFDVPSAVAINVVLRATSGTLEWGPFQLSLYK